VSQATQVTQLEKAAIGRLLTTRELKPLRSTVNFDAINVKDRAFSGIGFVMEFERSQELKLFDDGVFLRWGKVGAGLSEETIANGYLIYVDDGSGAGADWEVAWPEVRDTSAIDNLLAKRD